MGKDKPKECPHFPISERRDRTHGKDKRSGMFAYPLPSLFHLYKYRPGRLAEWFWDLYKRRMGEISGQIVELLRHEGKVADRETGTLYLES